MKKILSLLVMINILSSWVFTYAIDIDWRWNSASAYEFSNNQKINRVLQYVRDWWMDKLDLLIYVIDNRLLLQPNLSSDRLDLYSRLSNSLKFMEGNLQKTRESNGKKYISFDFFSLPNSKEEAKGWVSPSKNINKSTKWRTYELDENTSFIVFKTTINPDAERSSQLMTGILYNEWLTFWCESNPSYMWNCPSGDGEQWAQGWYSISFKNQKIKTVSEMYSD